MKERAQNDCQASGLDVVPLKTDNGREAEFFGVLQVKGEEKNDYKPSLYLNLRYQWEM